MSLKISSAKSTELIAIDKDGAKSLVDELVAKLTSESIYSGAKADICDYLLYLLNKYDKNHFLDSRSLLENARFLKMSASKIKSTKANIAIKFMDDKDYQEISKSLFTRLLDERHLKDDANKEYFKLIIDNPAQRFVLEEKLKAISDDTLEYTLNSEIVRIKKQSLLALLSAHFTESQMQKVLARVQKDEPKLSEALKKILDGGKKIGADIFKRVAAEAVISWFALS